MTLTWLLLALIGVALVALMIQGRAPTTGRGGP